MERLNRTTRTSGTYPVKIVQFGEGNFLRCFIDWLVFQMNNNAGYDAGVAVVQPIPTGMVNVLNEQGGLYTVRLKGLLDGEPKITHELIDVVAFGVDPYTNFEQYISLAEDPGIELLVSNTTEAGISWAENQSIDDHPPASYPAKVTQFLYRRFQHFGGDPDMGLVIMPCELIDRNGEKLREYVLKHASEWVLEAEFTDWLESACKFCNTLVDRIVPGYPRDEAAQICEQLGYDDQLIVEGELFHLMAIEAPVGVESVFPATSAGLNVIFTDNLQLYRTRKVRILNGAHIAMVPVGLLLGLQTVRDAMRHPIVGKFIEGFLREEVVPAMDDDAEELHGYVDTILERFDNPYIRHYLSSIALNAISKYGTRVAPTVRDHIEKTGQLPQRAVVALAALLRFYGATDDETHLTVKDNDEVTAFLGGLWMRHREAEISLAQLVESALSRDDLWGTDLGSIALLSDAVTRYLKDIEYSPSEGLESIITKLNAS